MYDCAYFTTIINIINDTFRSLPSYLTSPVMYIYSNY